MVAVHTVTVLALLASSSPAPAAAATIATATATTAAAAVRPVPRDNFIVVRTVSAGTTAVPVAVLALAVVVFFVTPATAAASTTPAAAAGTTSVIMRPVPHADLTAVQTTRSRATTMIGTSMAKRRTGWARDGFMMWLLIEIMGEAGLVLRFSAARVVLRSPALATAMFGTPMIRRTPVARGRSIIAVVGASVGVVGLVLRLPAMATTVLGMTMVTRRIGRAYEIIKRRHLLVDSVRVARPVLRSLAMTAAMVMVRRSSRARGSSLIPVVAYSMRMVRSVF